MKRLFPITRTAPAVFFLLLMIAAAGCKNAADAPPAPPPAEVPVLTLQSSTAATFQDYAAAIQGKTDVAIRPQVSGYLEHIYVDEGAYVTAGQPLFRIDAAPFRQQMNNADANTLAADAAVIAARLEADKLKPLVDNNVVSDVQLKTAQAALKLAEARAQQARAAAGSARINLGYTIIKAPASGYIGRLPYKKGSLVSSADPQPLTTLSDVREVHAYFSMSEGEYIVFSRQYPSGNKAAMPAATLVLADGTEYPVPGKVDMVDGRFDNTTGAITLRATFPNNEGMLRSGNTGKVRIQQDFNNAVLIPQEATLEMQDKIFVYAVDAQNKVAKQPITVAGKSGTDYILKEGIAEGSRIVRSGLEKLQEGAQIKPVAPTATVTAK